MELPCRYCGQATEMVDVAKGVAQIRNLDGSVHHCHEQERSQAIPIIFRGQIEDACQPLTPDGVIGELRNLYEYWSQSCLGEENTLYALNGAIELVKLVSKTE